jgi:hypothetical protein
MALRCRERAPSTTSRAAADGHIARTRVPLTYLEAVHEGVQALGVSPETAQAFGAGYAPKGIMRGRFAIPLHDRAGMLVASYGRSVKGESPTLNFPNGLRPDSLIFAAERVQGGSLGRRFQATRFKILYDHFDDHWILRENPGFGRSFVSRIEDARVRHPLERQLGIY